MSKLKQLPNRFLKFFKKWRIVILAIFASVIFVISAFHFEWNWTGFVEDEIKTTTTETNAHGEITTTEGITDIPSKTLWDLLEVLIIPLALLVVVMLFNKAERDKENDRKIEKEWQTYLDRITDLMEKGLLEPEKDSALQKIARIRTLAILWRLDGIRKGMLVRFLHEAALIRSPAIVILEQADLSGANLEGAFLWGDDLTNANLRDANLKGANLHQTILRNADLSGADLRDCRPSSTILQHAILVNANLSGVDLNGVDLSNADLNKADLSNANLTWSNLQGTKNLEKANLTTTKYSQDTSWPEGFDPSHKGAILVEDTLL